MQQKSLIQISLSIIFFLSITVFPGELTRQNPLAAGSLPAGILGAAETGIHASAPPALPALQEFTRVPSGSHIGVLYVIHGGMDTNKPQYMFDAAVQQFSYDPNHSVYKLLSGTR